MDCYSWLGVVLLDLWLDSAEIESIFIITQKTGLFWESEVPISALVWYPLASLSNPVSADYVNEQMCIERAQSEEIRTLFWGFYREVEWNCIWFKIISKIFWCISWESCSCSIVVIWQKEYCTASSREFLRAIFESMSLNFECNPDFDSHNCSFLAFWIKLNI